jgi:UDP-N-acetylglucosamine 2-epimerase (non-hydrolysing)
MPRRRRRSAARRPLKLLVTCHRRENWGSGLTSLAMALVALARSGTVAIDVVLHPNPQVAATMWTLLNGEPGIRLGTPLGHRAMIERMRDSDLILSDSGGVQEEAPALGIPCSCCATRPSVPSASLSAAPCSSAPTPRG